MAGYKLLKRKVGVDEISDDFSDFSLSSPATKIRRLDAGLPPIVEEEEPLPLTPTPTPPPNEERALVLFKPLLHSPSSFSLTLDSDLISEIKNQQHPWLKQNDSDCCERLHDNQRLAIVPWVPQSSFSSHCNDSENTPNTELMEADEIGEEGGMASMMMDIENNPSTSSTTHHPPTTMNLYQHQGVPDGFQQHCFLPQFPQNTSTPVTWTR